MFGSLFWSFQVWDLASGFRAAASSLTCSGYGSISILGIVLGVVAPMEHQPTALNRK